MIKGFIFGFLAGWLHLSNAHWAIMPRHVESAEVQQVVVE